MSFKYLKLKARIVEKYGTQGEFSKSLGLSENSISRKMMGNVAFTHADIVEWSKLLDISKDEIGDYFFA